MTIKESGPAAGSHTRRHSKPDNMLVVVLSTIIAITVATIIWVGYVPQPYQGLNLAIRRIVPGFNQGNRGHLQGVLTVQHQRRTAANRNSDTHIDTLSIYLNHREIQDLHSSE